MGKVILTSLANFNKMKILYLTFLLLISFQFTAQNKFDDLEYKFINESIEVGYPMSNFEPIFKECSTTNLCVGVDVSDIMIGRYRLENNTFLNLYFSEGQSDDPQLIVEYNKENSSIFLILTWQGFDLPF